MGQVGQGPLLYFSPLPIGLSQEDTGRGVSIGDDCNVHVHQYMVNSGQCKGKTKTIHNLHGYTLQAGLFAK